MLNAEKLRGKWGVYSQSFQMLVESKAVSLKKKKMCCYYCLLYVLCTTVCVFFLTFFKGCLYFKQSEIFCNFFIQGWPLMFWGKA